MAAQRITQLQGDPDFNPDVLSKRSHAEYTEGKSLTEMVRDDLVAQMTVMCEDRADPRKARRYALLLGEGQKYPRLMQRYKETVIGPRHDAMREVIRRGIGSGELRADTDVEIALLALTGTVLAKEKAADGSLNGEFAARIVDELMLGLAAR